ncbi:MAG: nucleoside deaminase [Deltaproteobacteria bacterium]|nr:nucleoside deaminase [Deltaproteobacteria bacterium]MBW2219492.1 nucleoside deaminase [Deltaproteobacteria bacterium]
MPDKNKHFMETAISLAEDTLKEGEFPVGCVIADSSNVLATGSRIHSSNIGVNEVDHAEIIALRRLADRREPLDNSKLTIYCTLEPCLMCFGAIILNNISNIVFAFEDVMGGGTGCDLKKLTPLYKKSSVTVVPGVLREKSLALFKSFFSNPANTYWKGSFLADYTLGL